MIGASVLEVSSEGLPSIYSYRETILIPTGQGMSAL